jgi:hypothetical protein
VEDIRFSASAGSVGQSGSEVDLEREQGCSPECGVIVRAGAALLIVT